MRALLASFHRGKVNVHVHCNGDLAAEAVLDAIESAVIEHPWLDHRHTITHAQTITSAQLRRAAQLRAGVNFFSNHLWYWGDQHAELTLGPDRAARLDPCADAVDAGVPFALHSDAPVTPLGQLHTMWCAMNRLTPSGRVLGPAQRIDAARALRAVTLDAAWLMHLDHEIGSIEVGKRADFTVLDDDPLEVDPMRVRDLDVLGTVLGGVAQPRSV
jgi:predicted amidohydrolase YtcJ